MSLGIFGTRQDHAARQGFGVLTPPGDNPLDPYFANVSLLLHMDGANGSGLFPDSSSFNQVVSRVGNAQVSTTNPKFGTGCGLFDPGSGDFLSSIHTAQYDLSTGAPDWTLEGYCLLDALPPPGGYRSLYEKDGVAFVSSVSYAIYIDSNDNFVCQLGDATALGAPRQTITIPTVLNAANGNYHAFAFVRSGANVLMFWDGVLIHTEPIAVVMKDGARTLLISRRQPAAGDYWDGKLDDFRITKGVARYTANYTVRTTAFPNSA